MEQDIDQVKSGGAPSEAPAVQREARHDDGAVVAGTVAGSVPEMVREGAQGAPGFLEESVMDNQEQVVKNEVERHGAQVQASRKDRDGGVGDPRPSFHLCLQ